MAHPLEDGLARLCARWVRFVCRRPRTVLVVAAGISAAFAVYAYFNLGVNSDPRTLISQDQPFQVRQREMVDTFHTLSDGILVVVDADSPSAVTRAAGRLAAELEKRSDLFTQVFIPGGGPFFEQNGFLYLSTDELNELSDRLAGAQPFLAELARDQSMAGLLNLLRQALEAQRKGEDVGIDLGTTLDRITAAIEATRAGRPSIDPWGVALLGSSLPPEAKRRIIALRPKLDYAQLLNAEPAVSAIRQAAVALGLTPERGVRVRVTGEPVLNYEEWISISHQSFEVAVASFILFSVAVYFAVRSLRISLALSVSLLVSLICTNGFAAVAVGDFNQISAAFAVFIVGLGGEFGIHAAMRYVELAASRKRTAALVEMAASVGPSLLSSAVTTATGFFIFLLTDFVGVAQLGLISGVGMFISLACTLTVLPAALCLGAGDEPQARHRPVAWLSRLEHLPLRYARPIRYAAAVTALACIALLPRIQFDYDLLSLRDPNSESVTTFEDLLRAGSNSPWTIDAVTASLDEAQAVAQRLEQLPTVASARTLLDYVPSDQEAKLAILKDMADFIPSPQVAKRAATREQQIASLEKLRDEAARVPPAAPLAGPAQRLAAAITGFLGSEAAREAAGKAIDELQANLIGSLPDQLADLQKSMTAEPVELADLPAELRDQMLAADGRARVEVMASEDLDDSDALERFVGDVRTIVPEATGSAVWMIAWGEVTWNAMLWALLGGITCIVIFLVILWQSVRDTALALFPLLLAAGLTCASIVLGGDAFNFANVIVLPMIMGMGIDNGVHLVHRHRTNPEEVDVLATSTAKAVFFAALTTVLSFGALAFVSHLGMAATGRLLTIGVVMTLVCYVVVLPAVLEWDDRRRRPASR